MVEGKCRRRLGLRDGDSGDHFPADDAIQTQPIRPLPFLAVDSLSRCGPAGRCRCEGRLRNCGSDSPDWLPVRLARCDSHLPGVAVRLVGGYGQGLSGRTVQTAHYWRFRGKGVTLAVASWFVVFGGNMAFCTSCGAQLPPGANV